MAYKNFSAAIYAPVSNLLAITDLKEFDKRFSFIERNVHIDKIYLETYRSGEYIDHEQMMLIKDYFENKGIKVSGGITTTDSRPQEAYGFTSLCYTNKDHRDRLKSVVEMTASIFDEIILDDFYFTNCKCDSCIEAKGDMSWSEFRLRLMKDISVDLVVTPAKKVNPDINMIIKFPNWYECFQENGYNLKDEPNIFDMIYTGTETRDPLYTQQHLPKYLSYFIMRYFENVKPGKNGGGWFDTFECRGNLNYYVEQAYLTMFSKPKEMTLFCLSALMDKRWSIFTPLAGYALSEVDEFLGELGNPVGTSCYIPYHSNGEDYLHNYIGMLGIPLEPYPEYPEGHGKIFLTESAAKDPNIVSKIDKTLRNGGDVIITSGLVKALADKGLGQMANIRWSGKKAKVSTYGISNTGLNLNAVAGSDKEILLPWMHVSTNDIWTLVEGLGTDNSVPVLMTVGYGKGHLFILTIPEDQGDLYNYPQEILTQIRKVFCTSPVSLETKAKVALFTYDNDTFVVESFLPYPENVKLVIDKPGAKLLDLVDKKVIEGTNVGNTTEFVVNLQQASYKALRIE